MNAVIRLHEIHKTYHTGEVDVHAVRDTELDHGVGGGEVEQHAPAGDGQEDEGQVVIPRHSQKQEHQREESQAAEH